jgi:hypothetical protein
VDVLIAESRLSEDACFYAELPLFFEFLEQFGLRFKVSFLGEALAFAEFTIYPEFAEPAKRLVL